MSPQDPPRAEPSADFAPWLLAAVLAHVTSTDGLQVQLRALDSERALMGDWPQLAGELDRVGWTLAVLSAMGAGSGELARHHPAGLRWLLSWQWGSQVAAPDLAPGGGVAWAWRVAERAFTEECVPRFQKCETGWRIRFGTTSPLEVPLEWVQD